MKIALITDTHFGARNDSFLFLEYFRKFYDNVFFPEMERLGITDIIHLGDVVDRRKYINFSTLKLMKEIFLDPASKYNLHIILGNHDITYRNSNKLNSPNELFYGYNNIKIYDRPTDVDFGSVKLGFVPWITPEISTETLNYLNSTTAQIIMGHLELNGFQMQRGITCDDGMDKSLFANFELVLSGHFHQKQDGGPINYLGAPYEMTFADMGEFHGFHIFDTDTRDLVFVDNPYKMFYRIYYDDKDKTLSEVVTKYDFAKYENSYVKLVVENKTNPYWFDKFVDKLYAINPADVKIIEDSIAVNGDDAPDVINAEDTLTILNDYVDALDVEMDKEKLKKIMRTLYNEAQVIEI